MKNTVFPLLLAALAAGCSSSTNNQTHSKYENIEILAQGQSLDDDSVMKEACQSFALTKEQISLFFTQAKTISAQELHDQYDILPCFSSGTLSFQEQQYSWLIRAGGTGELSTSSSTINKVCSEKDCSNISGLH